MTITATGFVCRKPHYSFYRQGHQSYLAFEKDDESFGPVKEKDVVQHKISLLSGGRWARCWINIGIIIIIIIITTLFHHGKHVQYTIIVLPHVRGLLKFT